MDGPPAGLDDRLEEESLDYGELFGGPADSATLSPPDEGKKAKKAGPKYIYVSYYLIIVGILIRNNHYCSQPLVLQDYLSLRIEGVTAAESASGKARQGHSYTNSRLLPGYSGAGTLG